MTIKTDRLAYTNGWNDYKAQNWQINIRYPFPNQVIPNSVVLSSGTVVNGSATVGWKPNFTLALTPEDATKLAWLWTTPVKTVTDESGP